MSNPVFITDTDVYGRIGGQARLTQLMDPENTGNWSQTTLDLAKADACNEVVAAAGVQILMDSDVAQFRDKYPHLVSTAAKRAVCLSWLYGSGGLAMPPNLVQLGTEVSAELERIATSRRATGSVSHTPRAASTVSGSVEIRGASLAGWKRTPFG